MSEPIAPADRRRSDVAQGVGEATAVASLAPGGSIEFNPPVRALELAELLGVQAPVARTVGIYMDRWEVELGDAVATLDGGATGERYSLPAAQGARVVASDRVRSLRR